MASTMPQPPTKCLVLDAGPLLSLTPLRGLAETFYTVPQVLEELQDRKVREHMEKLSQLHGIKMQVQQPDVAAFAHVVQMAKKTGDYSVLSHVDLCVLALTYALDLKEKAEELRILAQAAHTESNANDANNTSLPPATSDEIPQNSGPVASTEESAENDADQSAVEPPAASLESQAEVNLAGEDMNATEAEDSSEREPLDVVLEPVVEGNAQPPTDLPSHSDPAIDSSDTNQPLFDDPSDSDDGEGEWITPANVALHKSHMMDLVPSESLSDPFTVVSRKGKGRRPQPKNVSNGGSQEPAKQIAVGCMTGDFAMQNVLLQMNLSLVSLDGKKIERVKNWVLRCHACFKICKDSSKKFCPTCGNPSLIRTSVTISSPNADGSAPAMEVHLKKNFQDRTRGTIYSIPAPKPGNSKTGNGEGLILREDQVEYMRAQKRADGKRQRDERKLLSNALHSKGDGTGVRVGDWMDPDWLPEMLSVGTGGAGRKGHDSRVPTGKDGMPIIGHGRKNPNERKHRK